MIYAIINFLFYFFLFFVYRSGKNRFDIYRIIVFLYLATAALCLVIYSQQPNQWPNLSLFPFIYLFIVLYILFFPLQHFDLSTKQTFWGDTKALFWLGWLVIILSFADAYISYNTVTERIYSGDWGQLRNDFYADDDNVQYYTSSFQRLIKNIVSYLHPFAVVYAFYQSTNPNRKLFTTLLFLSMAISLFIGATAVASRGMVFNFSMEMVLGYFLFRHKMASNVKRILSVGGLIVFALFLIYSIAVSFSRFGEEDTGNSIFFYFGHSMLYFNDGLFNYLHDFAYGKRFFAWFIDLFGGNSAFDFATAGSKHGTAFFTIVGGIYSDWGFIGTIIASLLICALILKFTRKKVLNLSDMVIIMFYISTLSGGIFAYGSSRGLLWIMTFVVYFIVKALEKPNNKSLIGKNIKQ